MKPLSITLALVSVLAACGGGADGESTSASESNITASAYPQTRYVSYLYRTALARQPDKAGLDSAINYLVTSGCTTATLGQLVVNVMTSVEFFQRALLPEDRITILYRAALGRAPDEEGFRYWNGRLTDGMPFLDVVESFTTSSEFDALTPQRCTP